MVISNVIECHRLFTFDGEYLLISSPQRDDFSDVGVSIFEHLLHLAAQCATLTNKFHQLQRASTHSKVEPLTCYEGHTSVGQMRLDHHQQLQRVEGGRSQLLVTVAVMARNNLCLTFLQQSALYKVSADRIRSNRRPDLFPSAVG